MVWDYMSIRCSLTSTPPVRCEGRRDQNTKLFEAARRAQNDPKEILSGRPRCYAALSQWRASHLILWSHQRRQVGCVRRREIITLVGLCR
jgi:hypothetical protein